jgi:hypothetical protein
MRKAPVIDESQHALRHHSRHVTLAMHVIDSFYWKIGKNFTLLRPHQVKLCLCFRQNY